MDKIKYYVRNGNDWDLVEGTVEEFAEYYSQFYFLSYKTYQNDPKCNGNKTCIYVEELANEFLKNGLKNSETLKKLSEIEFVENNTNKTISFNNRSIYSKKEKAIFFIIAWKIGAIIYKDCSYNRFVFKESSRYDEKNNTYVLYGPPTIVFSKKFVNEIYKIDLCNNSYAEALKEIIHSEHASNIGLTYAITLMFFISNGKYPIYDVFAAQALHALTNNTEIGSDIKGYSAEIDKKAKDCDKQIDYFLSSLYGLANIEDNPAPNMKKYEGKTKYIHSLNKLFGDRWQTNRDIDRALWVYGHLFKS